MEPNNIIIASNGFTYCLKDKVKELVEWYEEEIQIYKEEYHYNGSPHRDKIKNTLLEALEIERR